MALRIDDAAVAFSADYRTHFLHLRGYVHLANGSRCVSASVLLCHVAQSTCGREVADGVALGVAEHVVGNADECVFLAEHLAVLAYECQAVNVRVDDDAEVILAALHLVHDALKILL